MIAKNSVQSSTVLELLNKLIGRISRLENILNGVPNTTAQIANAAITEAKIKDLAVTTAKIDDLAVTNAKIDSLEVSKLTAGTLGVNEYILIHDTVEDEDVILIGHQSGGFG